MGILLPITLGRGASVGPMSRAVFAGVAGAPGNCVASFKSAPAAGFASASAGETGRDGLLEGAAAVRL